MKNKIQDLWLTTLICIFHLTHISQPYSLVWNCISLIIAAICGGCTCSHKHECLFDLWHSTHTYEISLKSYMSTLCPSHIVLIFAFVQNCVCRKLLRVMRCVRIRRTNGRHSSLSCTFTAHIACRHPVLIIIMGIRCVQSYPSCTSRHNNFQSRGSRLPCAGWYIACSQKRTFRNILGEQVRVLHLSFVCAKSHASNRLGLHNREPSLATSTSPPKHSTSTTSSSPPPPPPPSSWSSSSSSAAREYNELHAREAQKVSPSSSRRATNGQVRYNNIFLRQNSSHIRIVVHKNYPKCKSHVIGG